MNWNYDISTAPTNRRILMATVDGGVFITNWLPPNKFTINGRWNGFPENAKTLLAWQDLPAHPTTGVIG